MKYELSNYDFSAKNDLESELFHIQYCEKSYIRWQIFWYNMIQFDHIQYQPKANSSYLLISFHISIYFRKRVY